MSRVQGFLLGLAVALSGGVGVLSAGVGLGVVEPDCAPEHSATANFCPTAQLDTSQVVAGDPAPDWTGTDWP